MIRRPIILSLAVAFGCSGEVHQPAPTVPPEHPPASGWTDAALDVVATLTDEELKAVLRYERPLTVPGPWNDEDFPLDFDRVPHAHLAITEAVRRGGKAWEAHFEGLAQDGSCAHLSSLTALRRLQGRPDPLEVLIEPADPLEVEWPGLPPCTIVLRNAETGGPPFATDPTASHRAGFLRSFRFDIRASDGTTLPVRRRSGDFGGVLSSTTLPPGGTWKGVFDPLSYVPLPPPGTYEVRAQYAESITFSGARDLRGWVYYSSRPRTLKVVRRRIEVTSAGRREHADAIAGLSEDGPIRYVAGTPVEDHPEFIAAGSPEGRILRAGWKAVPALLDAVKSKDASPRRNAWLFALLFGITGANDPFPSFLEEDGDEVPGVMAGDCEAMVGGPHSSLGGQGGPFVLHSKVSGGTFEPEAQEAFADRWRKARAWLEIVEK